MNVLASFDAVTLRVALFYVVVGLSILVILVSRWVSIKKQFTTDQMCKLWMGIFGVFAGGTLIAAARGFGFLEVFTGILAFIAWCFGYKHIKQRDLEGWDA